MRNNNPVNINGDEVKVHISKALVWSAYVRKAQATCQLKHNTVQRS